jgi:alpha-tubulin suppressor-like RCC1 family protein
MVSRLRVRKLAFITATLAIAGLLCASTGGAAGTALAATGGAAIPGRAAAAKGAVAWGDDSGGQLGNGTVTQSDAPAGVGNLTGIQAIAAGHRFTLALLPNGTVEAWGLNIDGQLGDGTTVSSDVPVPVQGLTGVTAIAAGGTHGLALLSNGTVEAWGGNLNGQLGDGTTKSSDVPVPVTGLSGVTAISAGSLHSMALLSSGTVMDWGSNQDGQLGNGTLTDSHVPIAVSGLSGVTAISAGGLFSVALLTGGTVETWGDGGEGQLGNGNGGGGLTPVKVKKLTGATAISAGYEHVLALLPGGKVDAWGDNLFGELGNPGKTQGQSGVPVPVKGLPGAATAISAGGDFSLALMSGGTVQAWGDGALGQLGNGSAGQSTTPVAVTGLTGVIAISAGIDDGYATVGTAGPVVTGTPESIFGTVPTPSPGVKPIEQGTRDVNFVSASAQSASNILAVGNNSNGLKNTLLAERWNGTSWHAATMPAPKGHKPTIRGVVDLGASDGWAVGYTTSGATNHQRTLIEHWNGSAWTVVPSPDPLRGTAGNDALEAVDGVSPTDVWAVGQRFSFNGGGITLIFEHFNGTTWTVARFPVTTRFELASAITTIAPDDAWVVGSFASEATLSAHWNGTRWAIVRTPSPTDGPNVLNNLTGVTAVSSTDVYASGWEGNVNNQNFAKPYILHWNGTAWTLVDLPNSGGEGSRANAIAALSGSDVWAFGQTQESDGSILDYAAQFNGTTWTMQPVPQPGQQGNLIDNSLDAAASPGQGTVWALGGKQTLGECCLQTLGMETTQG